MRNWTYAVVLVWLAANSSGLHAENDAAAEALADGARAFRSGDVAAAIELWSEADAAFAEQGDRVGRIQALLRRAEAHQLEGYLGRAAADLAQCRVLVEPLPRGQLPLDLQALCQPLEIAHEDDFAAAILAGNLGRTCGSLGERGRAVALLEQSLTLATAQQRWGLAAAMHLNLGNLSMAEGDDAAALRDFDQGFVIAERLGDQDLAVSIAINAARANVATIEAMAAQGREPTATAKEERLAQAELWLRKAHEWLRPSGGEGSSLTLSLAYAVALLEVYELDMTRSPRRAGTIRKSFEQIARAVRAGTSGSGEPSAGAPNWRSLSLAHGYLGRLFEVEGRRQAALDHTEAALLAAQQLEDPALSYRWYWQWGRLLRDGRRLRDDTLRHDIELTDQAIAAYQRAREHLEAVRPDLLAAYGGFGGPFRQAIGPVYLELAELLLARADRSDGEARQADLRAARDAVEQLKAAELEDYFRDDCVASLEARVTGIDRLAADTAALYPILLDDRIELILSLDGGLVHRTTWIDRAQLQATATAFVRAIKRRRGRDFASPARQLHDWLIAPFARELDAAAGITTLIIVPDGALRMVPLAALHDGERFLIERYAVAVTPGLRLLDPKPIGHRRFDLLLGGLTKAVELENPIEGTPSHFDALPQVHAEVERIRQIFGTEQPPLQDENFLKKNLGAELDRQPYTVVHLATHGMFDRDSDKSFLLTYDGQLTMDELEEFVKYSEFREDPVELLGLSACETAAGDERAALGLAGVGVKAGARSVLASLWQVEDRAAASLVTGFYERLQDPAISKAKALQGAQLELVRSGSRGHPGLWSPFILIGNWL